MKEDINIFDFTLANTEMDSLRKLDRMVPMIGTAEDPEKVESAMKW